MATSVISFIAEGYTDIMENRSDPRVKDWFLMSGPLPTLMICLCYAYTAKVLGPRFMEKRKPFELRKTIIVYNFLQVLFSIWLFYEAIQAGWFTTYSFRCQPVDYSNSPHALRTVNGCWWYFFSKFTEFFDTMFFVLRKKNNQISKLHIIHHGVMPMSTWFGVKFTPGGHSTFFGMLNTFVHIVMYSYYLLAAFGPSVRKYLWWKKYLTMLQMVQFVLVMVHAFQLLFIDCDYPKAFVWWIGLHAVLFYFLFKEFYEAEYKKKQQLVQSAKTAAAAETNGKVVNGSDLVARSFEARNGQLRERNNAKSSTGNGAGPSSLYQVPQPENGYCSSGYTTSEGAFIDKHRD